MGCVSGINGLGGEKKGGMGVNGELGEGSLETRAAGVRLCQDVYIGRSI